MILTMLAVALAAAAVASLPLAAGTSLAARAFGRAADRYRIVAGGFGLIVAVAPLSLAIAVCRHAPQPAYPAAMASALNGSTLPALVALTIISAVLVLGLAGDVIRLRRVKRRATPLGTLAVRGARLGTSPKVGTPTAIGYLHPAVVVPDGFEARVDPAEWAAVVAHECAHLSRWDDWAKAVQSAIVRAGWWLPGLWILSRRLDLERELASDERAATTSGARRYAACLLRLATDRWNDAVAPGLWNRRSHVAIRVERLLRPAIAARPVARAITLGAVSAASLAVVTVAVLAVPGLAPNAPAPRTVAHAARHARAVHVALHQRRRPARTAGANVSLRAASPLKATVVAVAAAARTIAEQSPATPHHPSGPPAAHAPGAAEIVAFVPRRPRCGSCFGPLRSPDVPVTAPAPSFPAAPSEATIAASDPSSGPLDLGSRMVWYRLPSLGIPGP